MEKPINLLQRTNTQPRPSSIAMIQAFTVRHMATKASCSEPASKANDKILSGFNLKAPVLKKTLSNIQYINQLLPFPTITAPPAS